MRFSGSCPIPGLAFNDIRIPTTIGRNARTIGVPSYRNRRPPITNSAIAAGRLRIAWRPWAGMSLGGLIANATLIAQSIRPKRVDDTGFAWRHQRARLAIDVPDEFDEMGPAKKAESWVSGNNDTRPIETCLATGGHVNILRRAQYSLPSIASGIQCRVAYCNMMRRPFPPPNPQRVCAWATLFNPVAPSGSMLHTSWKHVEF